MKLSARRRAGGSVHAMKTIAGGTTCLRVCWLKERSHMTHNHPTSAEGLTPAYLNGLLAESLPEARVAKVNVNDAKNSARKRDVEGQTVSVRVDHGSRRIIKK